MKKTKKKEFNEKEFKTFLNELADKFDKEQLESPLFRHFFDNLEYFEDPDNFQTMVLYPITRKIELVLRAKFNKKDNL